SLMFCLSLRPLLLKVVHARVVAVTVPEGLAGVVPWRTVAALVVAILVIWVTIEPIVVVAPPMVPAVVMAVVVVIPIVRACLRRHCQHQHRSAREQHWRHAFE